MIATERDLGGRQCGPWDGSWTGHWATLFEFQLCPCLAGPPRASHFTPLSPCLLNTEMRVLLTTGDAINEARTWHAVSMPWRVVLTPVNNTQSDEGIMKRSGGRGFSEGVVAFELGGMAGVWRKDGRQRRVPGRGVRCRPHRGGGGWEARAIGFSLAAAEGTESRSASSQAGSGMRGPECQDEDLLFDLPHPGEAGERSERSQAEEDESGSMGRVDWRRRDWGRRGHLKSCCKIGFPDKELG